MDETDRCHVEYSIKKWCRLLALGNGKQLGTLLGTLGDHLKVVITYLEGKVIRIEIPNLLKKRDNYTRDRQVTSKTLPSNLVETSKQDVDIDVEEEKEKDFDVTRTIAKENPNVKIETRPEPIASIIKRIIPPWEEKEGIDE
ncbi:hypothetical protein LCGC14_0679730 [marine sediment metagenome]|uniref:Uncharacterized protein n=1 Tax=marine sediment metagenome TaxID=412755 RepID=A0A0F9QNI7_9ZZZZ